jgi:hypothetical protein
MRASTGVTRACPAGGAGEGARSPATRSITSSAGVSSTVSLTGSAVSSPYRSAPPGARQRTDTW